MRLLLKFFITELALGGLLLWGLYYSPWWGPAAWGGLGLAVGVGGLVLGLKGWVMHSKSPKLIQRGLLSVVLSMAVRALALAGGVWWAVKQMEAPGAFLLGFLCVYAMQLVLEVGYLLLEQKRQSSSQRENG